jgi:hypothetical protein
MLLHVAGLLTAHPTSVGVLDTSSISITLYTLLATGPAVHLVEGFKKQPTSTPFSSLAGTYEPHVLQQQQQQQRKAAAAAVKEGSIVNGPQTPHNPKQLHQHTCGGLQLMSANAAHRPSSQ